MCKLSNFNALMNINCKRGCFSLKPELLIPINNEQVKKIQIEALSNLINFFTDNDIKYFAIAGTLLGSVRHQGFIPWDDDIDIALPREEYEKFITLFSKKYNKVEGSLYFLQNWDTDSQFAMPFSKLRVNNTIFKEKVTRNVDFHHGIYIDIFPFDNVHTFKTKNLLQNKGGSILHKFILIKSNYELINKHVHKFLRILLTPISKRLLIHTFLKLTINSNKYADKMVCTGGSYGFSKEIVMKKWFSKATSLRFESLNLKCPYYYHEYLNNLYGDYSTFPPIHERYNRHSIVEKFLILENCTLPQE